MAEEQAGQEEKKKETEKKPAPEKQSVWPAIIEAVKNPLGFFALAILICEAVLATGIALSGLTEAHKFILYCVLAALLFVLVIVVAVITIWFPRHLNPEMAEALKASKEAIDITKKLEEVMAGGGFKEAILMIVREGLHLQPPGSSASPDNLIQATKETQDALSDQS